MKYCMSCFRKIPLIANKCPYCIERNQTIWGRLFLVLFLISGLVIGSRCYSNYKKGDIEHKELIKMLDNVGIK